MNQQYPQAQQHPSQYPQGQPHPSQQPQAQYPQAGARPAKSPTSGKTVAGIILLAVAGLFFLPTAFFGYFAVANYGSASRLADSLQPEAQWAVRIVENKAKKQAMIAGVTGFLTFAFGAAGIGLVVAGRKKKAQPGAALQQQWAGQQSVHPQVGGQPQAPAQPPMTPPGYGQV